MNSNIIFRVFSKRRRKHFFFILNYRPTNFGIGDQTKASKGFWYPETETELRIVASNQVFETF